MGEGVRFFTPLAPGIDNEGVEASPWVVRVFLRSRRVRAWCEPVLAWSKTLSQMLTSTQMRPHGGVSVDHVQDGLDRLSLYHSGPLWDDLFFLGGLSQA